MVAIIVREVRVSERQFAKHRTDGEASVFVITDTVYSLAKQDRTPTFSQFLKITQNVAFEFSKFGIFHQFVSN